MRAPLEAEVELKGLWFGPLMGGIQFKRYTGVANGCRAGLSHFLCHSVSYVEEQKTSLLLLTVQAADHGTKQPWVPLPELKPIRNIRLNNPNLKGAHAHGFFGYPSIEKIVCTNFERSSVQGGCEYGVD